MVSLFPEHHMSHVNPSQVRTSVVAYGLWPLTSWSTLYVIEAAAVLRDHLKLSRQLSFDLHTRALFLSLLGSAASQQQQNSLCQQLLNPSSEMMHLKRWGPKLRRLKRKKTISLLFMSSLMPSALGVKSSDANTEEKLKLLVQDVYMLKASGRRIQGDFFFFSS